MAKESDIERMEQVAREIFTTILMCEEALDAFVMFSGVNGNAQVATRLQAARAHIRHARAIARDAGLFKPQAAAGGRP